MKCIVAGYKIGLAYLKAGFGLAAVRRALKTAAAAVFKANSAAAKFCIGLVGIKDSCKFSLQLSRGVEAAFHS